MELTFTLHEVGYGASQLVSSMVVDAIGGGRQKPLGCERFVSREDLYKLEFIVNRDCFVIWCKFTVSATPASAILTPAVAMSPIVATISPAQPAVGASRAPPQSSPPPMWVVRALHSMSRLPADLSCLLEAEARSDVDFEARGRRSGARREGMND
jgi:hypothetical protein